ncbi:DNA gyrase inhibitor YacG [Hydrogenophaga aromaticivorans]|uniref:DNA gyrase inhibitor YacG n=1 Tax=Hydrogenophaga TaxID=47420 RepID=UPI001B35990F|nr:DNA gyrase inhibitor YacG [Hydrogenophaga aromaticivorans]MBQ0920184.1 DNA gyrase inhibitor YacG [Hydrogenophaga aromaticivorans]
MPEPEFTVKTVACPACKGPSIYAPSNIYRPFCSERCKNLDLGAWASERFKLPEQTPNTDPDFEQS